MTTQKILLVAAVSILLCKIVGAILSTCWYAIRRNVFPGVVTKNLPRWAKWTQAGVEAITNLPGSVMAATAKETPPTLPTTTPVN